MRRAPFACLVVLLLTPALALALILLSAAHATAQTRTVTADRFLSKLSPWVDVTAYAGIDRTGATASNTGIAAAMAACPALTLYSTYGGVNAQGGCTIYLPAGLYKVTGNLPYKSGMRFVGDGRGTEILFQPTSSSTDLFSPDSGSSSVVDVQWRDLMIWNWSANGRDGIHIDKTYHFLISNVLVAGFTRYGVYVGATGAGAQYYNRIDAAELYNSATNLYVDTGANALTISGGHIRSDVLNKWDSTPFPTPDYLAVVKATNTTFRGTAFEGAPTYALIHDQGAGTSFEGCYLENTALSGAPFAVRDVSMDKYGPMRLTGALTGGTLAVKYENFDRTGEATVWEQSAPTDLSYGAPQPIPAIVNGSFDKGVYQWTTWMNHATVTRDTATTFNSAASLKVVHSGDGSDHFIYQAVDLSKYMNKQIYITAMVYWTTGGSYPQLYVDMGQGVRNRFMSPLVDFGNHWQMWGASVNVTHAMSNVDIVFPGNPSQNGTVTTNGTTTLTGVSTQFTSTLAAGDVIYVTGETARTVSTVPSNTSLTVSVAFSTTGSGKTLTKKTPTGTTVYVTNVQMWTGGRPTTPAQLQETYRATAAPTTGTWATGDLVDDSTAATQGWQCTSGGTSGTWIPRAQWTRTGTTIKPVNAGDAVNATTYVAQATGWQITDYGSADFRFLFTDELRAKLFTADSESVLAGSSMVTKSYSTVSQTFTCPAAGATATLWVKDAATFGDAAVFVANDWVVLHNVSRAVFGPFTIADCVGQVSSYADGSGANAGQQSWTFTRGTGGNAGGMSTGGTIAVDQLVMDMGVSGNGVVETTAVDGTASVNAPYLQIKTWATSPVAANWTTRVRVGNLLGATGSAEWGLLAGTYAATNGTFFRASDTNFDLQGITAKWWDSTTNVITIAPNSGSPYLGLGNPAPSACCTTAGIFLGWDHAATKAKASFYSDTNNYLTFDGTKVTWKAANTALDSSGNLTASSATLSGSVTASSGAIGGWTLGATSLTSTSGGNTVGMYSSGTNSFVAGPTGAPTFTVTPAGQMTATGATLTNGQIVFDNGTFMKVAGMGFGSTSQFIEWWGPHLASLSSCTEANAVYYLKTDGSAYFGGALLAGLLRNSTSATVLNDTNVATLGGFSSNGGSITTTWGYDFYANKTYIPSDIAGWTAADRTAPTATFRLERSTNGGTSYSTVWNNTVCAGTVNAEAPNGVDPGYITKQVNCGGTYADPDHNTNARAYRLSFVSDAHVFLPGGVTRNTLALGSVEQ
jgi:hypothetical protein